MATTTKSKSKRTTKKPTTASKSTSIKSVKKSSVKTTVAKPASTSKTTLRAPLNPLDRIRSMFISSSLVYLIFAGLIIGFVTTSAVAVKLGVQTRDQFAGGSEVVLASAGEVLYNIEPKYVLAGALLTSAIFSILLATKLRARYEATLANRTSGFRWLALGISGALMISFLGLLTGITDLATLKLSAFLIFLTTMLSFMAERENIGLARPKWLAYDLSLITGALAWLPIFISLIGTSLYGMERFGWHVYALVAVTLIGFTGFAINQYRHLSAGVAKDYSQVEENYLRIDLLTKFATVLIVLLALK